MEVLLLADDWICEKRAVIEKEVSEEIAEAIMMPTKTGIEKTHKNEIGHQTVMNTQQDGHEQSICPI